MARLRSLAIVALVAAIAAAAWFLVAPFAGGAVVAIALIPLIPLAVLRFVSAVFLLVAVIALVADATPYLSAGQPFLSTSFSEHWAQLAPSSLQAAKSSVTQAAGAWMWDGVIGAVIGRPTFLLFGILAAISGYAGRRRRTVEVYVN